MRAYAVFLDDGGVMNDNARRGAEWRRLLGDFFPSRLGGQAEEWSEANRAMIEGLWEKHFLEQARLGLVDAYAAWSRAYQVDWLRTMAAQVGVPVPADDGSALALAVEAAVYVTSNCRSYFADAPPAIRVLAAVGHQLHTASGEESRELDGYLRSMGVREHFGLLFGPDLVDAFKAGPVYYERAFARAGLDPRDCVVVDDSPRALGWASEAGARTVLVDRTGAASDGYESHAISALDGLADVLAAMEG